jgi:hypothetical protein
MSTRKQAEGTIAGAVKHNRKAEEQTYEDL